ncbi:MAG: sulfite exporter TauE/SafE family protein [Candidatus Anammoxibacter sp.]
MHIEYYLLPLVALVAFLAYLLKAMTGFGPAIVFISLGSLFIAPHPAVATSSILDIIAGLILLKIDWKKGSYSFGVPLVIAIVVGTAIGALFLKSIPPESFRTMLSVVIFILGIWFIAGRKSTKEANLQDKLPAKCKKIDTCLTFIGGICGGFFGISGPPIIWNFGRQYAKKAFRQVLIPIFIVAAITRVAMYSATGMIDRQVLTYVAVALPGLLSGILAGNKLFFKFSEQAFRTIIGSALLVAAAKLFL